MSQLSPDGFASRFTACSRTLWCIAAAIVGGPEGAEDVLQEAALIALRKIEQFDPDTTFSVWMAQIVRYVALNHARSRNRNRIRAVDPVQLDDRAAAADPETGEDFDDDMLAALRQLDTDARACLLLRVVMDMPYREIAQALQIPQGTAMSHVHRARRSLGERLKSATPSGISR
jgi:RNA polymerase sigma-70 factor (ECF subfamily)